MPDAKPLIRVHAEWGERMRTVAVIAAISAVVALAFYRLVRVRRILALITTIIAAWACYCVFEAAEHGGAMVYHHGVGLAAYAQWTGRQPWRLSTCQPDARARGCHSERLKWHWFVLVSCPRNSIQDSGVAEVTECLPRPAAELSEFIL